MRHLRNPAARKAAGSNVIISDNGLAQVSEAGNSKIGKCDATSVAQESCPSAQNSSRPCPFLHSGCYAEYGMTANTTRELNRAGDKKDATPADCAKAEAEVLEFLAAERKEKHKKFQPMRLHVVGDCVTDSAAATVASACKDWDTVWAYTHAWRDVSRSSWGKVSVLASCETLEDLRKAHGKGYALAMVWPQDEFPQKASWKVGEFKFQPCPNEAVSMDIQCTRCKLCLDANRLKSDKVVILFKSHSQGKAKAKAALVNIKGKEGEDVLLGPGWTEGGKEGA